MKISKINLIISLLIKIYLKRSFKHFVFELIDIFLIDFKYNTRTFVRVNNSKDNYVPYYTTVFKKNIKKLKKYIRFENTYLIDLGCGKGRILLSSINLGFKKIIGIEKNKDLYLECKKNINKNNLNNKINLFNQDFLQLNVNIKKGKNIVFFWYGSGKKNQLKKIIFGYKRKYSKNKIFFYIIPDKHVPKHNSVKSLYHLIDFQDDKTRNSKIITFLENR